MVGLLLAYDERPRLAAAWHGLRRSRLGLAAAALLGLTLLTGAGLVLYRQAQHPTHAGRGYIWRIAGEMFARHPLWGNGPFTFGTEFIRAYFVPPEVLLAHAHNFYLNVLAETGLAGGLALGWGLMASAAMAWRRWRSATPAERRWLAGLIAALVGLAVNSLFETPQMFPANNLLTMMLLGLLAAGEAPPASAARQRLGNVALAANWLVVTATLGWSLGAYAPFSQGVLASNLGDWNTGARLLQAAAERDPGVAFYWLQAGFAQGQAALDDAGRVTDPAALAAATNAYRRGTALEPEYSTNWANQGMLLWSNGDLESARAALERAVAGAETNASFRATLGRLYEALNEPNWPGRRMRWRWS
jgi:hypothetical protein